MFTGFWVSSIARCEACVSGRSSHLTRSILQWRSTGRGLLRIRSRIADYELEDALDCPPDKAIN
jgi:hypothetical protein